jgi:peptide/nickel transport system ATP-binding protein
MAEGERSLRAHRWKDVAMVFQGSMNALNPVMKVGRQIEEALSLHGELGRAARAARVRELLAMVGIAARWADAYPHQLSGGMRQRSCIAMALACEPALILTDEPTTALDVMIQAQILELLIRLSEELGLALILVTHDIPLVSRTCRRAAVMRDGAIVEQDAVEQLYRSPSHAYTRELFDAVPRLPQLTRTLDERSVGA